MKENLNTGIKTETVHIPDLMNETTDKDGHMLKTGTCRFCHQPHMVAFNYDAPQDVVDEEATRSCGCDLARHHKAFELNTEQAREKIEKLMKNYPVGKEVIKSYINKNFLFEDSASGTQAIFKYAVFVIDNVTLKISTDKEDKIKIRKRSVTEEE